MLQESDGKHTVTEAFIVSSYSIWTTDRSEFRGTKRTKWSCWNTIQARYLSGGFAFFTFELLCWQIQTKGFQTESSTSSWKWIRLVQNTNSTDIVHPRVSPAVHPSSRIDQALLVAIVINRE
jgi:hypothetical protein